MMELGTTAAVVLTETAKSPVSFVPGDLTVSVAV
jgi:hypothetical protein